MAELPHLWRAYARIQQQLSGCTTLGHRAWGLEAALDVLVSPEAGSSESELSRKIATAERRHRHRRARLRRYAGDVHEEASPREWIADALDAEQILQRIRSVVTNVDWSALSGIAEGDSYAELAEVLETSSGALRVRIARVRRQVSSLAA
jgi:hypothetical protein